MASYEPVLELLVEGGAASFYRRPDDSGGWLYSRKLCNSGFNEVPAEVIENFERQQREAVSSSQRRPSEFPSLKEAILDLEPEGSWLFYHPRNLHPDCCAALWEFVEETFTTLRPNRQTDDDGLLNRWRRVCRVG